LDKHTKELESRVSDIDDIEARLEAATAALAARQMVVVDVARQEPRRPAHVPPYVPPPKATPPPKRSSSLPKKHAPSVVALARELGITVEELEADSSFKRFSLLDMNDDNDKK
jgi:hypothetical protein